jgi:hypothetical protein
VIHHPDKQLFVLYTEGNPAGAAELDLRKPKYNISISD